jgi:hypothetical protein
VSGTGIPDGSTISSVDSSTQITISNAATATNAGVTLNFGGTFSNPTAIFDYDPAGNAITTISPADGNLSTLPAYLTRMLILPTGQVLFSDWSNQGWIYTRTDSVSSSVLPTITQVAYSGGVYTLTGTQLSGQSAGSAYGDDVESDENYPIVKLVNGAGTVYYARTTNWSYVGVGGGSTSQTVNFTTTAPVGTYSLTVSGAGISSNAVNLTIGRRRSQITSQ